MSTPLIDGLVFPEALRWHNGRLWFVDMFAGQVLSVSAAGELASVGAFADRTSGIGFRPDPESTPLVVLMDSHQVMVLHRSGPEQLVEIAVAPGQYLNDMVVDRHGRAYVDCVGDGSAEGPDDTILLLQPGGSYAPASTTTLHGPNGMAITPDGRILIVAEPMASRLTAFTIEPDGTLIDGRLFADTGDDRADGICIDAEGAVWFGSGRRGRFVRVLEGGEVTNTIETGQRWAVSCVLGGEERRTLFMATSEVPETLAHSVSGRLSLASIVSELKRARGFIETTQVEVPSVGTP